MSWQEKINAALDARRAADALRRRYPVAQGAGRWLVADDRQYLNFSCNDYLGLSHHPDIIRAWKQGAEQFGVGSGGSGHVSGYSVAHQALEEELAEWLGYSRALLFISGFAANQGSYYRDDGERGPYCCRSAESRLIAGSCQFKPGAASPFYP